MGGVQCLLDRGGSGDEGRREGGAEKGSVERGRERERERGMEGGREGEGSVRGVSESKGLARGRSSVGAVLPCLC